MSTRLDARIEAAAKALKAHDEGNEWPSVKALGWYPSMASVALAAADSVERPAVERLVAALRYQLDAWGERVVRQKDPKYAEAEALLAEFGQQPTGEA